MCAAVPEGFDPFTKVIKKNDFENCLNIWVSTDRVGRTYKEDMVFSREDGRLYAFKRKFIHLGIKGLVSGGTDLLIDSQRLAAEYGQEETYAFNLTFFEME